VKKRPDSVITVFGIRNCDKIKRTLAWFEQHKVAVRFHDYRKDGIDEATLRAWFKALDWNSLVNRAGTTWRGLPEDTRAGISSAAAAQRLMASHPALIKRPVIVSSNAIDVGYDEARFARIAAQDHA